MTGRTASTRMQHRRISRRSPVPITRSSPFDGAIGLTHKRLCSASLRRADLRNSARGDAGGSGDHDRGRFRHRGALLNTVRNARPSTGSDDEPVFGARGLRY